MKRMLVSLLSLFTTDGVPCERLSFKRYIKMYMLDSRAVHYIDTEKNQPRISIADVN